MGYFLGIFTAKSNLEMEEILGAGEHKMTDEILNTLF